jgi:hypothetical protein
MRLIFQIFGNVVGIVLAVAGLLGSKVPLPAVLAWLQNPFVSGVAVLLAVTILALTWADFIAEHRIAKAGGVSKMEFPARFAHWDALNSFEVWHAAYLWADLEPFDPETRKTRAYPEFRRLQQDLDNDRTPTTSGAWILSRQQLIDYAVLRRERPKFLFPYMRSIRARLRRYLFGPIEIDPAEVPKYKSSMDWAGDLWIYYQRKFEFDQIRTEIFKALRSGELEAIGRPEVRKLEYPYVKIPDSFWKDATEHWEFEVPRKGPVYKSILLRASSKMKLSASQAS